MEDDNRVRRWQNRLVMVTGGASVVLGLLVLVGWYAHNTTLIQVLPDLVPMQYNTALGFLVCGVGLLGVACGWPPLAVGCGVIAALIGLLT